MYGAQIDVIHPNGSGGMAASGDVAQRLLSGGLSVNALRTQDILRKDEWKLFDTTVINVARERLVIAGDLFSRGLTFPVNNALGTTILEWEGATHMEGAEVNMSGITPDRGDRMEFNLHAVPLPIIHKGFQLNIRHLEASRKLGATIDTLQAAQAARVVSETVEAMIINGNPMVVGTSQIYGLKNHPDRGTASLTDWSLGGTTPEVIVAEILAMMDTAATDHYYGPFMLYVPQAIWNAKFQDDYKANGDRTLLERVRNIDGIVDVRPSNNLVATEALLVQMTSDVVDLIDGIQPMLVQWDSNGGFTVNFKVMAIIIPRVKSTETNQSGIVHGT